MKHQELFKGLIRLHILHHAAEGEFYGQWMIEELARHGYRGPADVIAIRSTRHARRHGVCCPVMLGPFWNSVVKRIFSDRTERLARVETMARRHARTGKHLNFRTIEALLVEEGYPEARKVFANPWTQSELNRLCQLAHNSPEKRERFLALAHHIPSAEG